MLLTDGEYHQTGHVRDVKSTRLRSKYDCYTKYNYTNLAVFNSIKSNIKKKTPNKMCITSLTH